jgi:cell wall-associated NlpC family hydrolase
LACKDIRLKAGVAAVAIGAVLVGWPASALADGGVAAPSHTTSPPTTTPPPEDSCTVGGGGVGGSSSCGPTGKATLLPTGLAVAPADAPRPVKRAIRFANQIVVGKPYRYGGGHRLPWRLDTGYDCSGSISWALHGARLLKAPLPSGSFRTWGVPGAGRWITVYYNGGHMYAVIAGLRLDTSMTPGIGPGWSTKVRFGGGYATRHAPGL